MKIVSVQKLVDNLLEKCGENVDEAKLTEIALFKHKNKWVFSHTVFIVLTVTALTVSIISGRCLFCLP